MSNLTLLLSVYISMLKLENMKKLVYGMKKWRLVENDCQKENGVVNPLKHPSF